MIATTNTALTYALRSIAAEIDKCSPELRDLIRMACTGANLDAPIVCPTVQNMAQMRLNEAAMLFTTKAKAARKAGRKFPLES